MADGGVELVVAELPVRVRVLEMPSQRGRVDDHLVAFLEAEHELLNALERGGGDGGGQLVPLHLVTHPSDQVIQPLTGTRAGGQIADEAAFAAEGEDLLFGEGRLAPVGPGRHKDSRARPTGPIGEGLEPIFGAPQRLCVVGRVKQHQGQLGVVEEQRVE